MKKATKILSDIPRSESETSRPTPNTLAVCPKYKLRISTQNPMVLDIRRLTILY